MEDRYIELMKHCIGLDRKKPYKRHGKLFYTPYRNYFYTSHNNDEWEMIMSAGYAEREENETKEKSYTYFLNRKGLDYLGEKLGIKIHDEMD